MWFILITNVFLFFWFTGWIHIQISVKHPRWSFLQNYLTFDCCKHFYREVHYRHFAADIFSAEWKVNCFSRFWYILQLETKCIFWHFSAIILACQTLNVLGFLRLKCQALKNLFFLEGMKTWKTLQWLTAATKRFSWEISFPKILRNLDR